MPSRWQSRLHAISVIAMRDTRSILFGFGIYIAVALGMAATAVIVRGHLAAIASNGQLILSDAFTFPFFVTTTIIMFYLALTSVATVAREKDLGTLEVLFYGPVDHVAYILAKHVAQVLAYLPICLATGGLILAYSAMTGLRLEPIFPLQMLLSIATMAAVTAFGIFLSTLTRGVRGAFALFGVTALAFLTIHLGADALTGVPLTNNYSPLLFLRDAMIALDAVISYISPFAVFQLGVDALVRGDGLNYLGMLALSLVHCGALLSAAVAMLRRRGVRR